MLFLILKQGFNLFEFGFKGINQTTQLFEKEVEHLGQELPLRCLQD
jgi:hypothetical protein